MRLVLISALLTLGAGAARAEVVTPAGCHWIPTAERADVVALWCRGPDGRAQPTGQTLQQPPNSWGDGCPGALIYDGVACVSEDQAMAAAALSRGAPQSSAAYAPARAAPPRVMLFADRRGRTTRGLACIDEREVTICKPIPRH